MKLEKGFESKVSLFIHSIKINKNLIMKWFNWHGFCNIIIRYLHHRMASCIENVKARMGRMENEEYCVKTCQPRTRKKGLASIFIKCWNEPIITSYLHETICQLLRTTSNIWRTNFGPLRNVNGGSWKFRN